MEIIKLGDRLTIPGKNVKGELAFVGKTHFSEGTWLGIILDDPVGKHSGIIGDKRYFKCEKNHGVFIRDTLLEKEYVKINGRSSFAKRTKQPHYSKASCKLKTDTTLCTSNSITNRKMKLRSQRKNIRNLSGDSVSNIDGENTDLTTISECGDVNASDKNSSRFVRRYPNYLKASSKIAGSHYCLNKTRDNKTDETVAGNLVADNIDKSMAPPTGDSNENKHCEDNESRKRIIYPNYLKASSKLAGKHFCVEKHKDVNNYELNDIPENVKMQTSKKCTDNGDNSESPYAYLVKYPYQQKTPTLNYTFLTKRFEMSRSKSVSKNEHRKTAEQSVVQDKCDTNNEIESLKLETEDLKTKLKNTEESIQEILSKYNEAQEEIKHLKYDNECQRRQIKFQKSHLKLLKMSQSNYFKKTDTLYLSSKQSKQTKIGELLERTLNEYTNRNANTDKKSDLESMKVTPPTQRVIELEEQNRLMTQGLVELRDFLKTQCKTPSVDPPMNYNNHKHFPNGSNKRCNCLESFGTSILIPDIGTTGESESQVKKCSEMLRELTKFNELVKEKNVEWEATDLTPESFVDGNSSQIHDSDSIKDSQTELTLTPSRGSTDNMDIENYFDPTKIETETGEFQNSSLLMENDIQNNCPTDIFQYLQPFPNQTIERNGNNHVTSEMFFQSDVCTDELNQYLSTKHYDEVSIPQNITLTEKDILENEVPECFEYSNSNNFEHQDFSQDIPGVSECITAKSTSNTSKTLPKRNTKVRKKYVPAANAMKSRNGINDK